jgi:hypothetical protein
MPCPFNLVSTRFHDLRQPVHFLAGEALIARKASRIQPEFRAASILADVHMDRFPRAAFVRKEEKTIALKLENGRHGWMLAHRFPFCLAATRQVIP